MKISSKLLAQSNPTDVFGPIELQYQYGFTSISQAINTLLTVAFFLAALAALFYLFIGALKYIVAGSDEAKLKNARSTMVHAVVGLIMMGLVMVIFQVIVASIPGLNQFFTFQFASHSSLETRDISQ